MNWLKRFWPKARPCSGCAVKSKYIDQLVKQHKGLRNEIIRLRQNGKAA